MTSLAILEYSGYKLDDQNHKRYMYVPLDRKVLAVMSADIVRLTFRVYIGAVAGDHHEAEWPDIARYGTKCYEGMARIIFPGFEELRYEY